MYNLNQQPNKPEQLERLSLAKFSHTTTAVNHHGPLNWSHIFSNGDIYCHFEKIPGVMSSAQSQVLLRVIQNQNILETVDLAYFAGEASSQNRLSRNGASRPIFAIVVKLPCLAVKYPTSNGIIRRFQLKFSSDRDFYTTLAILSEIKCPFSESNISSTQLNRRPTSSQWSSTPAPPIFGTREPYNGNIGGGIYQTSPPIPTNTIISSVTTGSSVPPSSSGTGQTTATDLSGMSHNDIEASIHRETIQPKTIQPGAEIKSFVSATPPTPACPDIKILEQLLPPKRELPFSKPAAKRACTIAQLSTLTPIPSIDNSPRNSDRIKIIASASQAPRKSLSSRKGTPNPGSSTLNQPKTLASQLSMSTELHSQLPGATISHPSPVTMRQQAICSIGPKDQTPTVENRIDQTHDGHQDDSLAMDLSTYCSAPTHERMVRLENWICRHIEDDGFIKLCQDVEGMWMRVAFGKPFQNI